MRALLRVGTITAIVALVAILATSCGSDDDSADEATSTTTEETTTTTTEATTTTAAPEPTEAPAEPNTSDPDLRDLSREETVYLADTREDFIIECVAETAETEQERCILIWNCAINEVGPAVAADPAQEAVLDEALNNCSAQIP